jgi:hypothetical protein
MGDRHHQVGRQHGASHSHDDHANEADVAPSSGVARTSYTGAGSIPPVATETVSSQPSASERAFAIKPESRGDAVHRMHNSMLLADSDATTLTTHCCRAT